MSTISEVDIRDWENVNLSNAKTALDRVIEYDCENTADDLEFTRLWKDFYALYQQVERIKEKQVQQATKNVAALFQPKR